MENIFYLYISDFICYKSKKTVIVKKYDNKCEFRKFCTKLEEAFCSNQFVTCHVTSRKYKFSAYATFKVLGTNLKRKAKKKVMTGIALNVALPTDPEVYFKPMLYTFIPTVILEK